MNNTGLREWFPPDRSNEGVKLKAGFSWSQFKPEGFEGSPSIGPRFMKVPWSARLTALGRSSIAPREGERAAGYSSRS